MDAFIQLPPAAPLASSLPPGASVGLRLWRKALARARAGSAWAALRWLVVDLVLFIGLRLGFGARAAISAGARYHPLFLLPDYHGPYFDEAVRRLVVAGSGPFAVHLSVTGACPNRCTYCYASAGGAGAQDLGRERLLEVAEAITATGVPIVNLTGGEPLLRFEQVLELVRLLRPHCEVRLATSGRGLDAERARALAAAGLSVLAVSLDGADQREFDAVRGCAGAFEHAVNAIRWSAGAGLTTVVTAVVRPSKKLTPESSSRFLRFVRGLHPGVWVNFVPQFAAGRGEDGFRGASEFAPVARTLSGVISRERHDASVLLEPVERLVGCLGAGGRQLSVDIAGNVTACISAASFGNVTTESYGVLAERAREQATRLKQGFFCASAFPGTGARVLGPDEARLALERFDRSRPDAWLQRVSDRAPLLLRWFVAGGLTAPRRGQLVPTNHGDNAQ